MTEPRAQRPAALGVSLWFGAIGAVLVLLGLVAAQRPLLFAGLVAGCASLGSVLVWRSQLIEAWTSERRNRLDT